MSVYTTKIKERRDIYLNWVDNPEHVPEGTDAFMTGVELPSTPAQITKVNSLLQNNGFVTEIKSNRISACVTPAKRAVEKKCRVSNIPKPYWYEFTDGVPEHILKIGMAHFKEDAAAETIESNLDSIITVNTETADIKIKGKNELTRIFKETYEKYAEQDLAPAYRVAQAIRSVMLKTLGARTIGRRGSSIKGCYIVAKELHQGLKALEKVVKGLNGSLIRTAISFPDESAKQSLAENLFKGYLLDIKDVAEKLQNMIDAGGFNSSTIDGLYEELKDLDIQSKQFEGILGIARGQISNLVSEAEKAAKELGEIKSAKRSEKTKKETLARDLANSNAVDKLRKAINEIENNNNDEKEDGNEEEDWDDDDDEFTL